MRTIASIPTLSIGLPVYNGERYLRTALDSLLAQDFHDFELIISDNASTDGTSAICREYADRDARIRHYRNEKNIGASGNYNRLVELARGEFFKWAAHDDVCLPGLLRRCMEAIQPAPVSVVLAYPRAILIDEAGRAIGPAPDRADADSEHPHRRLGRCLFYVQTGHPLWGVIRLQALRQTRLMGCLLSDFVLLAELALRGRIREVPEVLFQLRIHRNNAAKRLIRPRDLLLWHDPSKTNESLWLPEWVRLRREYLRAVRHAALPPGEALLCGATILGTPVWRGVLRWTGPVRGWLGFGKQGRPSHTDEADLTTDIPVEWTDEQHTCLVPPPSAASTRPSQASSKHAADS